MATKEYNKILSNLMTSDEQEVLDDVIEDVVKEVKIIGEKVDDLENRVASSIDSRDKVYSEAFKNIVKEWGEVMTDYDSRLNRQSEKKTEEIKSIIKKLENASESAKKDIKEEIERLKKFVVKVEDTIVYLNYSRDKVEKTIEEKMLKLFEETKTSDQSINKTVEQLKIEIRKRLGGGQAPRKISLGGTETATKYSDINWIGSGVTLSASNNETFKRTDITVTANSSTLILTPTGTVNGVNQTFVFTVAPSIMVVDQGRIMQKTSSDGTVNWTGTTTVVLSVAPNFDIFGF